MMRSKIKIGLGNGLLSGSGVRLSGKGRCGVSIGLVFICGITYCSSLAEQGLNWLRSPE
jgi:hypothetical protein